MNTFLKNLSLAASACCCIASIAAAQESTPPKPTPSKPTPQEEAGEPRANTSAPPPAAPSAQPAQSAPSAKPAKQGPSTPADPSGKAKGPGGTDRLNLGTATVTGDREQPKVMYIVPWKRSDIGDLAGKPMNSLVDEILSPVDRDVFKREVVYYKAVQSDATQNGASAHRSSDRSEK